MLLQFTVCLSCETNNPWLWQCALGGCWRGVAGLGHATGSGTSSPECSGALCHHIAVPWLSPGHVFSELLPFFFLWKWALLCQTKQNEQWFGVFAETQMFLQRLKWQSGTSSSRLLFRAVISITYLRLTWRLVLASRISQSPKIFCGSVLVQRCSACAVLVFGNYLGRAQNPS